MKHNSKQHCELLRYEAKQTFDQIRTTWCDLLKWGNPHRATWILSQTPGERKNNHIVDATHVLALRSYVAGFLEGNSSATRPWYRIGTRDSELSDNDENKAWLQHFTQRTLKILGSSNFYYAAGSFYYDYGTVNTGAHYIEELDNGFFVHTLIPGAYFVINDRFGVANILIREFTLNVKSIVDTYGKKDKNGKADWSNISSHVRTMYEDGDYSQLVDIVHTVKENSEFDRKEPNKFGNRKWIEQTYELGGQGGHYYMQGMEFGHGDATPENDVFLKVHTTKRKPFIVGKSTQDFEYGEKGPTIDSLGLIKSLNKKAISKDQAIEQILKPALQGPANLRKSYITTAPNSYIPVDGRATSSKQKIESIFQVNPAIGALTQDVEDMRQQVDKLYYADFLLFLSKNPKTRTATEAAAVVEEQQRVIGPNLQSLNTTYNVPFIEWLMDYTLFEDPYLRPPPAALEGLSLKPEFISIFAQAQKAADLPSINQYVQMIMGAGQINPKIIDKMNVDKLADIYEDRLYLPSGLNNPQGKVEAMREQAEREAQRQRQLQETLPAVAKAAKDAAGAQQLQQ